ncbi:MAG: hypothetical protein U9M92_00885 [Patescibacteria group bacterium]|nr:hypothetical protein [Patescibacteria group bacterium]
MIKPKTKERGLIKLILLVVVALVVLGYYRVDVQNIIESDLVQRNLNYVWGIVKVAGSWIWDKIGPLVENLPIPW